MDIRVVWNTSAKCFRLLGRDWVISVLSVASWSLSFRRLSFNSTVLNWREENFRWFEKNVDTVYLKRTNFVYLSALSRCTKESRGLNVPGVKSGSFIKLVDTILWPDNIENTHNSSSPYKSVALYFADNFFFFSGKVLCGIYRWPPFMLCECDIAFLPCRSRAAI